MMNLNKIKKGTELNKFLNCLFQVKSYVQNYLDIRSETTVQSVSF